MRSAWEVIVVGAGPAGSATALQLARAGRSVLLLDRARFPRDKPCAEYASPETEQVLRRLGIWSAIEAGGVRRLRGIVIIGPSGRRFASEYLDGGLARRSLAISRRRLDDLLVRAAAAAGVEVRQEVLVEAPLVEHGCVVGVKTRRRDRRVEPLRAGVVVGADGLRSRLARMLGGGHAPGWPRRLGLATHVEEYEDLGEWAEMYVGRGGYCGLAPVGGGLTAVAGAVVVPGSHRPRGARERLPSGEAEQGFLGARSGAGLARALAPHPDLLARLARARRAGPIRGVGPLAWTVPRTAGPGYLLVGDAAGFFDPFTGEGIFRALRGAELAAETLARALEDRNWPAMARRYAAVRGDAFAAKERLARLIQHFVQRPVLLEYALERLERRPELAERLSAALGDYGPPTAATQPGFLARLLRP